MLPLSKCNIFGGEIMAKRCDICGKGVLFGKNVSHSNKTTRRRFSPNVKKVRARINGKVKKIKVCTKCLKAGKVDLVR